jgi:hypothetical protein
MFVPLQTATPQYCSYIYRIANEPSADLSEIRAKDESLWEVQGHVRISNRPIGRTTIEGVAITTKKETDDLLGG